MTTKMPWAYNHVSVDCVVIGFDGEQLRVLLLNRTTEDDGVAHTDMKLPGSLIYMDEDLDTAAQRVLFELTGLRGVDMLQFKTYGSLGRTQCERDVRWLESVAGERVERIVTVAYLSVVKLDQALERKVSEHDGQWVSAEEVGPLAFDHNVIVSEALSHIRHVCRRSPELMFSLLPKKFTASQLRTIFQIVNGREEDVRNFHKKMIRMDYVVPLEEKQQGVAHRAARYFRFDKKLYNRSRGV